MVLCGFDTAGSCMPTKTYWEGSKRRKKDPAGLRAEHEVWGHTGSINLVYAYAR